MISVFKAAARKPRKSEVGIGCFISRGEHTTEPDIIEQARSWIVLPPGGSTDVQDELSKSIVIGEAGSYRLRVIYVAPAPEPSDRQRLQESGVSLPAPGRYESTTVAFEIKPSHSMAN